MLWNDSNVAITSYPETPFSHFYEVAHYAWKGLHISKSIHFRHKQKLNHSKKMQKKNKTTRNNQNIPEFSPISQPFFGSLAFLSSSARWAKRSILVLISLTTRWPLRSTSSPCAFKGAGHQQEQWIFLDVCQLICYMYTYIYIYIYFIIIHHVLKKILLKFRMLFLAATQFF